MAPYQDGLIIELTEANRERLAAGLDDLAALLRTDHELTEATLGTDVEFAFSGAIASTTVTVRVKIPGART